jgi:4-carboxymuconolactone decarboxylase
MVCPKVSLDKDVSARWPTHKIVFEKRSKVLSMRERLGDVPSSEIWRQVVDGLGDAAQTVFCRECMWKMVKDIRPPRVFTPKLSALVDNPLYSQVWEDADLSKRDRSLITVAALVALGHSDELPAHLRRAISNGVTRTELAAAITHLAFYAGFPAAITASVIANEALG